jgi:hypothetical protein
LWVFGKDYKARQVAKRLSKLLEEITIFKGSVPLAVNDSEFDIANLRLKS